MNARELTVAGEYVARLERGADWREEIEAFAARRDLAAAWFQAFGTVEDAELWFYDQSDREFRAVEFDEPLTVAAALGSVSRGDDGEQFAHTHAVLSRRSGQALAGHLNAGTVFAGEAHLRAFEEPLDRSYDETTGLDLPI